MGEAVVTKADPGAAGWAIRDPVIRLRRRGDERSFVLEGAERLVAGTAGESAIRLDEGEGVSREHAAFERRGDEWTVSDLGSTNGTRQDGEDRKTFVLAPGMEVELGRARLIAESARSRAVVELLRRLIGWSPAKILDVDRGLQAIRQAAHLRSSLILVGDGSLVGMARRLHRLVLGDDRPLSVHGRRESGIAALERARDGMLYLDAENLPMDLALVLASCRLPDWRVRLVVGASSEKIAAQVATRIPSVASIIIPPLSDRDDELERVLLAFADDAVTALEATGSALRPQDLRWVRDGGIATLDLADEVMSRLVAVRNWGVSGGAARLDLTHGALSKYLKRRKLPT